MPINAGGLNGKLASQLAFSLVLSGSVFFRSSKTAMRVLNYYGNDRDIAMKRIQYRRGLGHHIETKMIGGMRIPIALCKEFKILEERPNDKTRI